MVLSINFTCLNVNSFRNISGMNGISYGVVHVTIYDILGYRKKTAILTQQVCTMDKTKLNGDLSVMKTKEYINI